ncbi:MAG: isochorismate synthase [Planctomycetota bacterium]
MDTRISSEPTSTHFQALLSRLDEMSIVGQSFPHVLEVAASDLDGWRLLQANVCENRITWSERAKERISFGLGTAAVVTMESGGDAASILAQCRNVIADNKRLRFYGGFSFNGNDSWDSFGAGRFVVPRLQLQDGVLSLAIMSPEDVASARDDLLRFQPAVEAFADDIPAPESTSYQPTFEGWQSRIDEALSLIRAEVLEKIVLSRKTKVAFAEVLDPVALAAKLDKTTYDCFVFCFDFGAGSAFVGATPERLFKRCGDRLESEVVAGTRMRGKTASEDEQLAIELLTSDKDQREHDIVRKSIRQKLHKFVEHLDVDSRASILRLANKQHLRSNVQGTLKSGVDDGMLLQRLHPTPAVGGYPTDNALPEISRIEPFDRGWYAAPVGWVSSDEAQFAVAIRSGLVDGKTLTLYSGAGIVRGSDPDEEWQEVENKIQDFIEVLGR